MTVIHCRVASLSSAAAHQVIYAGGSGVLQGTDRVADGFEHAAHVTGELRMHHRAMQRHLALRIDHHRATDEDGQIKVANRPDHPPAFGPVSARGKADHQPGFDRPMNRLPDPRRDLAGGGQQGAIQIDGDHPISMAGGFTVASRTFFTLNDLSHACIKLPAGMACFYRSTTHEDQTVKPHCVLD